MAEEKQGELPSLAGEIRLKIIRGGELQRLAATLTDLALLDFDNMTSYVSKLGAVNIHISGAMGPDVVNQLPTVAEPQPIQRRIRGPNKPKDPAVVREFHERLACVLHQWGAVFGGEKFDMIGREVTRITGISCLPNTVLRWQEPQRMPQREEQRLAIVNMPPPPTVQKQYGHLQHPTEFGVMIAKLLGPAGSAKTLTEIAAALQFEARQVTPMQLHGWMHDPEQAAKLPPELREMLLAQLREAFHIKK